MITASSLAQKGLVLILVPLIGETVCLILFGFLLLGAQKDLNELQQERQTLFQLHSITSLAAEALIPLAQVDNLQEFKANFVRTKAAQHAISVLKSALEEHSDSSLKTAILQANELNTRLNGLLSYTEDLITKKDTTKLELLRLERRELFSVLLHFEELNKTIVLAETQTDAKSKKQLKHIFQAMVFGISSIVSVSIGLAIVLLLFFTRDMISRLNLVIANAKHLIDRNDSIDKISGDDEISKLNQYLVDANKALIESRRKELQVLDSAPDIVCRLGSDLRFVLVSRSALNLWDKGAAELIGHPLLMLIPDESAQAVKQNFEAVSRTENSANFETTMKVRQSTPERMFSWSVTLSEDRKSFFCVVRDVTDLKAMQLFKGQFLAMISHDIKAPLTSIALNIDLLLSGVRGKISSRLNTELEKVQRTVLQTKRLADDLLDLGKLEAGKHASHSTAQHAFNLCATAKEFHQILSEQAGVRVSGPQSDALVLVDEKQMTRAIANLLAYAINMCEVGRTVSLAIQLRNDSVEISVIAEKFISIECNHYFASLAANAQKNFSSDIHKSFLGLSIGLEIARAIIENHQGNLIAEPTGLGGGFLITLPNLYGADGIEALDEEHNFVVDFPNEQSE